MTNSKWSRKFKYYYHHHHCPLIENLSQLSHTWNFQLVFLCWNSTKQQIFYNFKSLLLLIYYRCTSHCFISLFRGLTSMYVSLLMHMCLYIWLKWADLLDFMSYMPDHIWRTAELAKCSTTLLLPFSLTVSLSGDSCGLSVFLTI